MKYVALFPLCALLLAACDERDEITRYEVPKNAPEAAQETEATQAEDVSQPAAAESQQQSSPQITRMPAATNSSSGSMQALPGMAEDVAGAEKPAWVAPDTWEAQPLGTMRKGSWSVPGPGGAAEVAVTAFPGDVGGVTANVQRWAGQVSLPPSAAETQQIGLDPGEATLVDIQREGHPQSMLAAILPHAGYSWFFKMTGPAETVEANREPFMQFLRSIDFGNE